MVEADQAHEDVRTHAAAAELDLPEATIAGVIANRRLLAEHLRRIEAALADPSR